jgi:cyanosortase A-associated protein
MSLSSRFWYTALLSCLTISVIAILGRSLIDPNWGKLKPISFSESIPLPQWTKTNSTAISIESEDEIPQKFSGKRYNYARKSQNSLTLEVFYWNSPSGNMEGFFSSYSQNKKDKLNTSTMDIRQQSQSYYGLYYRQNTAHLTSCINPRGNSTVTNQQFLQNRYTYDQQPNRWLGIALGLKRLRDWKCLWVNLSISSNIKDVDRNYKILIDAWSYIDTNRYRYFADFVDQD